MIYSINNLVVRSFFTGFFAACIVGPVFTLVLYRTITQGLAAGLVSASGMAIADGIFFFLATASGLSSSGSSFLLNNIKAFETVGGPLMITFGVWTLFKPSEPQDEEVKVRLNYSWLVMSSMFLTLSNPLTIIFFGAIAAQLFPDMATLSIYKIGFSSISLALGSFSLLSSAIFFIKRQKHLNPEGMIHFLRTLSGIGLLLTGCLLTFQLWVRPATNNSLWLSISWFSK